MLCVTFNKQYKKANTEDHADNVMMLDSAGLWTLALKQLGAI